MTERITISVPDDLAEQINKQLSYGDNRSEWIRAAIEQRLHGVVRDEPRTRTYERERSPQPEPERSDEAVSSVETDTLREQAEDVLDGLDVPGRAAVVEKTRRDAVMWAWEWLRVNETAKPREIANATFGAFFDDPDLGYSTASGRYAGYQLWDNFLRNVLSELPGVVKGQTHWRFDPETQVT